MRITNKSHAETRGVRVLVESRFLEEQSQPAAERFAFAYRVRIENVGNEVVQLRTRHWVITDATGHVEEVRGLAVVGHQPLLKPGEAFEYTSWTQVATPQATMRGTFFCMTEDAHPFDTPVAEFALVFPGALH